jgi:hypothetical protein
MNLEMMNEKAMSGDVAVANWRAVNETGNAAAGRPRFLGRSDFGPWFAGKLP